MLSETEIEALLAPFDIHLTNVQTRQLRAYLDLLMRWNAKINLTSIRDPKECVARHFGESLLLARHVRLSGWLLDIGSGAGFPGLALKILAPALRVTLLEPIAKKRAFLKEAARQCGFEEVEIRGERLDEFRLAPNGRLDVITARAVGGLYGLITQSADILCESGKLCLWLSRDQVKGLMAGGNPRGVIWCKTIDIPSLRGSIILIGERSDVSRETFSERSITGS